jgi:hypothetical protein
MIWSRGARVNLENRIAHLERQSGLTDVPQWVRDLSNDDRSFYLALKKREAAHNRGFDGLIRTLDEGELTRYLSLLLVRLDGADLDDETRADVDESKRRLADYLTRRPTPATA